MTPRPEETIRILTVDDDPTLLSTISMYLQDIGGFTVRSTGSAREALDLLETEYFDICISDYDMPGMNGVQLLGRMREDGNNTPYILITGNTRDGVEMRARHAGASEVLQKSGISTKFYTDLVAAVKRVVERYRGSGSPGVEMPGSVRA